MTATEERRRSMRLALRGAAAGPTAAEVEVVALSAAARLRRAGLALAAGVAVSLVALPVPIVHFVLVPGGVLAGFALTLRRLAQREIFAGGHGVCPYCGTEQRFTLVGAFRLPKRVDCASCHRELRLQPDAATSG